MDAVVLTWRWQNIFSIWIMIIALFLLITLGMQISKRRDGSKAANNG